jgi:hypothetical protein
MCSQERKQEKIKLMKKQINKLALAIAVVGNFALSANSAKAVGFSQAPPVNLNTGAEFLITWNGTTFSVSGPSGEGPFDGIEDTLFGVQNTSTAPLLSLFLTGTSSIGIFGFDGDGIGFFNGTGPAPGSPGPTGYEGWTSSSSMWGTGTQEAVSFIVNNLNSGTVVFGANGIQAGGSAYFALEDHLTNIDCGPEGCGIGVPDTGSTLLLLGLACGFGLLFQRRGLRS